jgi:hypothetical protein
MKTVIASASQRRQAAHQRKALGMGSNLIFDQQDCFASFDFAALRSGCSQ